MVGLRSESIPPVVISPDWSLVPKGKSGRCCFSTRAFLFAFICIFQSAHCQKTVFKVPHELGEVLCCPWSRPAEPGRVSGWPMAVAHTRGSAKIL